MMITNRYKYMGSFKENTITLGTILRTTGIILIVCITILYVHFQARNFIQGPRLELSDTLDTFQNERIITVHGNAHNVVKLSVNGKEIHTNEQGIFTHTLVLENNYTIMSIDALDRFGRKTSIQKEFIYIPQQT